jgi:hypothetical protein
LGGLSGITLAFVMAASGHASPPGNSLNVHPPRHARESLNIRDTDSFSITVAGSASPASDLYVFQEGADGCAALESELEFARDAQELYYRFAVSGDFSHRTSWDAFRDAGRHWACAYLATQTGRELRHRFVPFTVTAPPVGRLRLDVGQHPRAGHRYQITLEGFAALSDSLWIYVEPRRAGACRSWYAFHDSTYGPSHVAYFMSVVHGRFHEATRWVPQRSGRYRACGYLVETNAYPQRILTRAATYRVR